MDEVSKSSESGESPIIFDLTPISPAVAIGLESDFLPSLIAPDGFETKRNYMHKLDISLKEKPDLNATFEEQFRAMAERKKAPLIKRIEKIRERYYRNESSGMSCAGLYELGFIAMFEACRREAQTRGGRMPEIDERVIEAAENLYLQPDIYPTLVTDRDELKEDMLAHAKPDLMPDFLEANMGAVKHLGVISRAVERVTFKKMMADFPSSEPHFYKALEASGITKLPERIGKPAEQYREALMRGLVDTRNIFLMAKKVNDEKSSG